MALAPGRRIVSGPTSLKIMMHQTRWLWPSNIAYSNSLLLGVWGQSLLHLNSKLVILNNSRLITKSVRFCPSITSSSSKILV